MQPNGGTLTMYAKYPLTCQVSTAHWANASISGTAPTFYTNTSPATALPSTTAQYTNVSSGKIMRFIGWALQNNGTPVITGDTIPSTYKGALTLYACYDECSLTITGAALPATGDPVLASGDTLALTAVPEGFPAGQTITYNWRVLPPNYPLTACATVSGSGANATVTPVAGASGSATVEVTATCGSLSASAMKNVTVVDFSVTGDTVINMSDTGKMLTASVAGYTGTIEYNWSVPVGATVSVSNDTGASRTFTPVSSGKTTVTVVIRLVNENITLPAKTIDIYVFDINLNVNGTGLTAPTPTNTNYGLMLTTEDTAGKTITASLSGSGMPAVTYTWTPGTGADTYIELTGSANNSRTVKPRAAGTAIFSVTANYNGTPVCTKTVDVAVAGLTLTGDSTHLFDSDPAAPPGANNIALTATLGGIAPGALTPAGITFVSDDTSIATVAAGSASATSRSATVTALKGGKVTITAKATIAATNTELTVTKEITIINIIVTDGSGTAVPATGNSLADGPVVLTAEFEGLTESGDFSWACTSPSGSDISITTTSGPTTTVSGTSGTASVTLTATYGGNGYNKTMEFRCQIGSKAAPDAVGDIVFSDGSAEPYDVDLTLSTEQANAAIAVIYDATDMKGVGLQQGTGKKWAPYRGNGYSKISALVCTPSTDNPAYASFSGLTDGSGSLATFRTTVGATEGIFLGDTDYPAWAFVEGYATTAGLTGTYADGWYMPSIAELCTLYKARTTVNNALGKIAGAAQLSGDYWSCSQVNDLESMYDSCAWSMQFGAGSIYKYSSKSSTDYNCCVIRAFP